MQFQANVNQFREQHWQKKITACYRVIILLALTLQTGVLMGNISAMPRAEGHLLPGSQQISLAKLSNPSPGQFVLSPLCKTTQTGQESSLDT